MELIRINIEPTIYSLEVRSHSNNHFVRGFCLKCLAKSKTNHEYLAYAQSPANPQSRICCKCGCMNIAAAITVYDIPKLFIVYLLSTGATFVNTKLNQEIGFDASPLTIYLLNKGQ